ncbi:MAG: DNA-processing protein DprA [bacterium]|nr:DNA-processing protein DprA [bacterium]
MEERIYWAHLASMEGVGGAVLDELIRRFGSIKRAMEAPLHEVSEIPGLDERTAEAICRALQSVELTNAKIEELTGRDIRVITKLDPDYPPRFHLGGNTPPVLYLYGNLTVEDDFCVAIIGSRDCSVVSARRAREYAQYFAKSGITVVTGYAAGVDMNAHLGAIEAGGRTIIIPGCGMDLFDIAPLREVGIEVFSDLKKHAVVISEQPPTADWSPQGSQARNRLVAVQARAVVVIEARLHSSTLDTVNRAQTLGRPIFAQVFAAVSERVMGNEKLLKAGASPLQDQSDLDIITNIIKVGTPVNPGTKFLDTRR